MRMTRACNHLAACDPCEPWVHRILVASLAIAVGAAACGPRQSSLADRATATSEAFQEKNQLPGLAVGIVQHGRVVYARGFGVAKHGRSDTVTARTVFHMASVTKPFVATAVLQLVESGKVELDAPVVRYLPFFKLKDPRYQAITVRQVLNHTAGLPDVSDYRWDHPEYDADALDRYVKGLRDSTLIAPPGEKWQYSNIGFEVLADLVAHVSGEPFEDYVQRHILTPLAMAHSTLLMSDVDSAHLATGHDRTAGALMVSPAYPYNRPHAGSSTLHSNVDDMLRWAMANNRRGELDGHRILNASSYDQLWTPTRDISADLGSRASEDHAQLPFDSMRIGLSWFLTRYHAHRLVDHEGSDRGFRSDLLLAPDDSAAVVVMSNVSDADVGFLSRALMLAALGLDSARVH
jgi:CubicO group peptidase (beta-lactamase class C family)